MTEPSAAEFVPTWTWLNDWTDVRMVKVSSTSTSAWYQVKSYDSSGVENTPAWMDERYSIEFRLESGNTVIYCNTNGSVDDDVPFYFAGTVVSQQIALNDSVTATHANGTTAYTFTVTSSLLWTASSGSGSGTLGDGDPTGSLSYRNSTLFYLIDAASPSSSSTDWYGISEDGTFIGQQNDIAHTSGDATGGSVTASLGSVYVLKHVNLDGTTVISDIATLTASKGSKVHCNFW